VFDNGYQIVKASEYIIITSAVRKSFQEFLFGKCTYKHQTFSPIRSARSANTRCHKTVVIVTHKKN